MIIQMFHHAAQCISSTMHDLISNTQAHSVATINLTMDSLEREGRDETF